MEASPDSIIEVREEVMVSPSTGGNPTCRTAYFLKPCIKDQACDFPPPHSMLFSGTVSSNHHAKLPLEVRYSGWLNPHEEWKTWVELMQSKYEHLWIKAGIDQSIKASTYQIHRNDDLILGLAKRWCSKTNTFIFPWGEATITLEDIKVCGDYSVLGDPISSPLETQEQKEAETKLVEARRIFNSTRSKKVGHKPWMMHFMKNESQVEHEAFLCLWLSRYVFPAIAINTILKCVIPIAIHLARGTKIALAPAVLASIYRDLTLLRNNIAIATINLEVTLWAPFQLVQIWALERFPALQPHAIELQSQPRMARWHNVKMPKINNLKLILDSAGATNCFLWQPYNNSPSLRLYNEKDMWECDNPCIESELQSFGRCMRVSELVGMGCIEQYLPHRVAMQFGMDQDIPGMVAPCQEDPWINYSQLVMDTINLFTTALCACHPNVTSRYYEWWKQSKLCKEEDTVKGSEDCVISICKEEYTRMGSDDCVISISSTEYMSQDSPVQLEDDGSNGPPPGFPSKHKRDQVGDSVQGDDESEIIEPLSSVNKYECFEDEMIGNSAGSRDELRGSNRIIEDVKMEDVGGGRSATEEASEAKPNSPICDTNGDNKERGGADPPAIHMVSASDIENRIWKLERVFAKLEAEKFGPKYENNGAKPNLSGSVLFGL